MKRFPGFVLLVVTSLFTLFGCKKNANEDELVSSLNEKYATSPESILENAFGSNDDGSGAVYVLSNQASGNQVLVYNRTTDGSLSSGGSFSTEGNGTGAGLGSQGSVILHEKGGNTYLFAVNAGSNEITVFRLTGNGLTWVDKVTSHGTTPISVTAHESILYVLNAGGSGNISGFQINTDGHLTYLENSTKSLGSNDAGPAQIQFNNAGSQLVVTEKNANRISTYSVYSNGLISDVVSHSSTGTTPFGFGFDNHDKLIVTDAFGGAVNESAVTSYNLSGSGSLSLIDGPKGTHQTAACWLAITNNGKYCYATNTGSASITGYSIRDGGLTLLNADGVTAGTGTTPTDIALTNNSKFIYNLNSTSHSVTFFKVREDGSLDALGSVNGLPVGAVGIAAK